MKNLYLVATLLATATLSGCMNLPTRPAEISSAHINGLMYEKVDCHRLSVEADSLARRESQLIIAQEQRYKTSQVQAFFFGYGQGDGIEASELANVRGEREAVRKAMALNRCVASLEPIPEEYRHHAGGTN